MKSFFKSASRNFFVALSTLNFLFYSNTSGNRQDFKYNIGASTYYPQRLEDPGWTGIPSASKCAIKSRIVYPSSKGFLYSSENELCIPVQGLEGSNTPGARVVGVEEGNLFLEPVECPSDFTLHNVGDGTQACLKVFSSFEDSPTAAGICSGLGATLAAAKSLDKVSLLVSLKTWDYMLIGLGDSAVEGTHVWTIDGTAMTQDDEDTLFASGQPNDLDGSQDCAEIGYNGLLINDISCTWARPFICEVALT